MSREIRRVPPDWRHPEMPDHSYAPLYDRSWQEAMAAFRADPEDYGSVAPNPLYYRPDFGDMATAYQVYETITEGTPISPVLATRDDLLRWLTEDGDGLGIGGRRMPLTREQAERFIEDAYAPSMVYSDRTGLVSGLLAE